MQAGILRKHLAVAALFTADADVRYYLRGVLIEVRSTEIRCAATDGNMAGVCRLRTEQDAMPDVIVPNETLKLALQSKSEVLALVCDGGKWSIAGIAFTPVDGKFPDYRRIIPASHSGEAAQFNPVFIATMAKAGKLLGRKDSPIIRHNGTGAAQVQFYANDEFVGVLMPLNAFTEKNPDLGLIRWGAERAA